MAPPKSTGREYFSRSFCEKIISESKSKGLSDKDIIATITNLTIRKVFRIKILIEF